MFFVGKLDRDNTFVSKNSIISAIEETFFDLLAMSNLDRSMIPRKFGFSCALASLCAVTNSKNVRTGGFYKAFPVSI
jgi:hypothetical protein